MPANADPVAPRPFYGITRIDQPEKKNHGFYVRITHQGQCHQKYFPDKSNGGKRKALVAAQSHRDALLATMPAQKIAAACKKKRKIKKSGVVGVTHVISVSTKGTEYEYWQAAWLTPDGRRKTAKFSIPRYGSKRARDMAVKAREAGLRPPQ